ncbi:hypothetical protein BN1723_003312 [Verticillium longisporum]|uniref:Uncharacterized protein n=1 Tax=Verticillium longisporum TaxID=100787 RepID=A0A0G4LV58_VERLO|nr:hypothetical protein BN1723_003312 [Verticillium longisporum]
MLSGSPMEAQMAVARLELNSLVLAGVLVGVLLVKDEVPVQGEMFCQTFHDRTIQTKADIRPSHTRALGAVH